MYEFLAPWGVLVPALSAAFSYTIVRHFRRRRLCRDMDFFAPRDAASAGPAHPDPLVSWIA